MTGPPHRLLLVEQDAHLRSLLRRGLGEEGFDVTAVGDGSAALEHAAERPDALVIDLGLHGGGGQEVRLALRARGVDAPALFLTAPEAADDRPPEDAGDAYVVKPFEFDEVVARLRALLGEPDGDGDGNGSAEAPAGGELQLDAAGQTVSDGTHELALTPTEFRLLSALAAQHGTVVRRRDLVRSAWPEGAIVYDNTLDQYVARLRRKLRTLSGDAGITTVRGVGYRLD